MKSILVFTLVLTFFCLNSIECKFNVKNLVNKFNDILDNKTPKVSKFRTRIQNFKFNFQNCGPSDDPFRVKSLTVQPDPFKLPGSLNFTGEGNIDADINGPLTMTLKLIKIVGPFKVEIPCIENFGSCTYNDVCSLLPTPDQCPPFFLEHKIPCTCPFPAGDYSATNVQVELDLPAKVPPGEYLLLANLQNKELGHVGCVQIDVKVSS